MRVIIYIFITLAFSSSLIAQRWHNVGFVGGYQTNFLLNNELSNDKTISTKMGFNPRIGIEYGFNTNEFFQLSLTASYARAGISLHYNTPDSVVNFTSKRKIRFNQFAIGIKARYFTGNGYFLQAGANYVLLPSVLEKDDNSIFSYNSKEFVKGYVELNAGIGMLAYKSGRANVLLGVNGSMGVTNFLSAKGKEFNYPTFKSYESNSIHRLVSVMFVVNLVYDVGKLNSSRQIHRYSYFKKTR